MKRRWIDLTPELTVWRQVMLDCIQEFPFDTVVFSHFVAINVVAGAATGNELMIQFRPDNCSVSHFNTDAGRLTLVARGREARTNIN